MWISRFTFAALTGHAEKSHAEMLKAQTEARTLAIQNEKMQVMLDWSRVRINHLERQFAAVLYSKTNIELPIPKIESAPTQQTNPNMLPDFDHVSDDDPTFKAHPEWYSTGPEPFPLPGVTEK